MNKMTILLVIVIMVLSFSLGTTMQSKAQEKNYAGIVPFVTSNDRVGFFNQNDGLIYLYDNNISQCVFVGQLEALGSAVKVVSSAPTDTLNR